MGTAMIYVQELFIWLFLTVAYAGAALLAWVVMVCLWAAIVSTGPTRSRCLAAALLFAIYPVYIVEFGWP